MLLYCWPPVKLPGPLSAANDSSEIKALPSVFNCHEKPSSSSPLKLENILSIRIYTFPLASAMLYLSLPISKSVLLYWFKNKRLFIVACASPERNMFKLKLGTNKFEANFLLESGMNALWDGFSKESYRVPVLYSENCCAKTFRVKNNKNRTSKNFFIYAVKRRLYPS